MLILYNPKSQTGLAIVSPLTHFALEKWYIKIVNGNQFDQNCFLNGGPAENTIAIERYIKLVTIKRPEKERFIVL